MAKKQNKRSPIKAWKWAGMKAAYTLWWESLSTEQKIAAKDNFEQLRLANEKKKYKFPDMYDLRHLRLSQLNDKHIDRIHTFRDRTPETL